MRTILYREYALFLKVRKDGGTGVETDPTFFFIPFPDVPVREAKLKNRTFLRGDDTTFADFPTNPRVKAYPMDTVMKKGKAPVPCPPEENNPACLSCQTKLKQLSRGFPGPLTGIRSPGTPWESMHTCGS